MTTARSYNPADAQPGEPDRPGWHRFLTSRDKQVLARTTWAKQEPFGLGERPVVVIVDDYYASLGHPRMDILEAVEQRPAAYGPDGWRAIDATAGLLGAARRNAIPVVYVKAFGHGPSSWNRKDQHRTRSQSRTAGPGAIVAELHPEKDDVVLEKCLPSAFQGTALDTLLRSWRKDTVLVCGEATSGCVRASVVDACGAGYSIGVVADCCFDRFEASHWMSLFDMEQKYADVITAEDACRYTDGIGQAQRHP